MCRAGVCFNLSWIRNYYHNIRPSPFLLEHQNRWSGCQPRVHERPRGHSRGGNVSNLNKLIQPTASDTRRSINLGLKLGQRRRIKAETASLMVSWHYTRVVAIFWVCQVVSKAPVKKRWNNVGLMMLRHWYQLPPYWVYWFNVLCYQFLVVYIAFPCLWFQNNHLPYSTSTQKHWTSVVLMMAHQH